MAKPKPKLTPVTVKIRLKSGKTTTGIRYKQLTPAASALTPPAGPTSAPVLSVKPPMALKVAEPSWVDDTNLDYDDAGPIYDHGFSLDLESGEIREWDRRRNETGSSPEEYYGHVAAVIFPGPLSAVSKAELFEKLRTNLDNRVYTYESVWDGQRFVNGAEEDEDADDALASILASYENTSFDYLNKLNEARDEEFGNDLERITESLTGDTVSATSTQGGELDGYLTLKDRRTGIEVEVNLYWGADFDRSTDAGLTELAALVVASNEDD